MIELTHTRSKVSIDTRGGRIQFLILNSVPLLSTFTRIDGKEANSHICAPNFNTEGVNTYALSHHGFARNLLWATSTQSATVCSIHCIVPPEGTYPSLLTMNQHFVLEQASLHHALEVTNEGSSDAPVNIGFHYYWDTPHGWDQLTINSENISKSIAKDTYIPAHNKNIIAISGKPRITLATGTSFSVLQLWTGRKIEKGSTAFDTAYACIEPVYKKPGYFDSTQSMLKPKESILCSLTISL